MDESAAMQSTTDGRRMHCDSCVQRVRAALRNGRESSTPRSPSARFFCRTSPEADGLDAVREKIAALGYSFPVTPRSRNPLRRFLGRPWRMNRASATSS